MMQGDGCGPTIAVPAVVLSTDKLYCCVGSESYANKRQDRRIHSPKEHPMIASLLVGLAVFDRKFALKARFCGRL